MLNLTPVSELFLQVRFPGEIHDVKEFVQPKQWHVQQLISDLKKQGPVTPELLWDWVCRNVQYPLDFRGHANEYHKLDAYALRPVYIIGWGQQVIPENRQVVWGEWFDWPWEILSAPKMVADCISADTEIICVVDNHYDSVPIGKLEGAKGVKVPSYNFEKQQIEIKPVSHVVPKGRKPVYEIQLRNGMSFECTANHRLFRAPTTYNYDGVEECTAFDLDKSQAGNNNRHHLISLRQLPALNRKTLVSDEELWIYGHYAAEGWSSPPKRGSKYRVSIAGDNPALRQALGFRLLCLGVPFTFSKRTRHASIEVRSSELRDKLATLGHNAFEKRFPSFVTGLTTDDIQVLLDGYIAGDTWLPKVGKEYTSGHKNETLEHSTSSDMLAQQLRLLHFILGRPLYSQYQLNHGGAGHKPIWRLYENKNSVFNRKYSPGLSKVPVRRIVSKGEQETFDLTVSGNHNFFLAKSGVLAHNCDGDSVLLASLIRGIGSDAYVAIGGFAGEADPLTHAWVVHNSQVWEVTAPEAGFALPEDNDVYIPLMYFNDERVLVTPELYGILKEMNYIPSIGNLCQNFGFGCDDCKKRAAVLSFHQKLKFSGIQSTVECGCGR